MTEDVTFVSPDERPLEPDLYADGIQVGVGGYGVTLTLLLSDPSAPNTFGRPIGRVRMSSELARAMVRLLTENLDKAAEAKSTRAEGTPQKTKGTG